MTPKQAPETETLSRLFLELHQFLPETKTARELRLEKEAAIQRARILELEAALATYATADYLTTQHQGIAHRALKIGGADFDKAMKRCPRCKGDGDSTVGGLACERCGGTGRV